MTDRDRLIAIVKDSLARNIDKSCNLAENIVDDLICECVILPPCKVGTKVWLLRKDRVPDDDYRMSFHDEWVLCEVSFRLSMINQIGKTVFLTREEAEKALKERENNDSN